MVLEMIKKTLGIVPVLLAIIALVAPAPITVLAAQQWNQITLPGKIHTGTVPVIGMSPTFPNDHTIFTEDGTTLYESRDGGNTWSDLESVHQDYCEIYGGNSTTKTPTARILIPPDVDCSNNVVWTTIMANDYYQDLSTRRSGNVVSPFMVKSSEPPPPPGPVSMVIRTILLGFAFGPNSTMYIAGGAEIYSGNMAPDYYQSNPEAWTSLCDVNSYIYDIELSPDFSNDHSMIIQTDDHGVLISTDGGHKFTQTSLPIADGYYYMRFSPNYASDGTIAVVVPGAGLFLSTDQGADWQDVLPGESVTAVAIGPSGTIYAGTDYTYGTQNGVYASFDRGQTWQNIGLEGSAVSSLYVFKGTVGENVYAATDSDLAWTTVTPSMTISTGEISPTLVQFTIGQDSYTVAGRIYQTDAAPYINNGRVYLPVRYLARTFKIGLAWDKSEQTLTLADSKKVLEMTIGVKQLTINGENTILNYPPVIKDGRTYILARLLATYMNYSVTWDGQNKTVIVSLP
jgi:hypothetical protein